MESKILKSEYLNLVRLIKKFIEESENLENERQGDFEQKRNWILTNPETFNYFKEEAIRMSKNKVHQELSKEIEPKQIQPKNTHLKDPIAENPYNHQETPLKNPNQTVDNLELKSNLTNLPIENREVKSLPIEIKTQEVTKTAPHSPVFELEPLLPIQKHDLKDVQKIVEQLKNPEIVSEEQLERMLQNEERSNNPEILIISENKDELSHLFLKEMEKSLTITLGTTKIISYNKFISKNDLTKLKLMINIENQKLTPPSQAKIVDVSNIKDLMNEPQKKSKLFQKIKDAFIS